MSKIFLKAKWENLILATYEINPELLDEYLSEGLKADTIEGKAFVSLVAFEFNDTKVLGMKIPWHINFPEINLRFYVKYGNQRGVVFIKELVPRRLISMTANLIYNENYRAVKMRRYYEENQYIKVKHYLKPDNKEYKISAVCENRFFLPDKNSPEHFFKEHEWGFVKDRRNKTKVYRVEHPLWETAEVKEFKTDLDFGEIYGHKWSFLNNLKPFNVCFAKGSPIKVYKAEDISKLN